MCGTKPEVAELADVSEAHSVFINVLLGLSDMSLRHSLWMYLTVIGRQNFNGVALEYRRFVDFELRRQFINYDIQ